METTISKGTTVQINLGFDCNVFKIEDWIIREWIAFYKEVNNTYPSYIFMSSELAYSFKSNSYTLLDYADKKGMKIYNISIKGSYDLEINEVIVC